MTANRTQDAAEDWRLILELKIDEAGKVTRKATRITRKDTLDDKLIGRLYPGIRVARVSVPNELSAYEESLVEERMKNLVYDGVRYKREFSAAMRTSEAVTLGEPVMPVFDGRDG